MRKHIKKISFIFFIIAIAVLFVSLCFIAVQSSHHCTGDGCDICYKISVAKDIFSGVKCAFALALCAVVISAKLNRKLSGLSLTFPATPVILKVKLSD